MHVPSEFEANAYSHGAPVKTQYVQMLIIKGSAAGLLLASQVLATRCLTLEQFGTFSYLNSVLVVLSFVVLWGADRYCVKRVALERKGVTEDRDSPDQLVAPERIGETLSNSYFMVLINCALVAAVLLAWLPMKLGGDFSVWLGLIAATILLARSLAQLNTSITRGLNQVVVAELIFNVLRPLVFVVPLAILYCTHVEVSLNFVLGLFAVSFCVAGIACALVNQRSSILKWNRNLTRLPHLYKISFFFFIVSVGLPLMSNINTIQLGNMRSDTEVALFASATKVVSLVLLALVSANLLIAPRLSPLFYGNDIEGMKKLIRNNNCFVLAMTTVPVLLIIFYSEQILAIFGAKYIAAAGLLQVLMIGQAVSVLCGPVVLTSTMTGLQKSAAVVILSSCLINWLICILLIPQYGAMGAVIASIVANILLNAILALKIYHDVGLNVTMWNLIR